MVTVARGLREIPDASAREPLGGLRFMMVSPGGLWFVFIFVLF